MRWLKIAYLSAGIALLAMVLWHADLGEVGRHLAGIGIGVAPLLAIAAANQAADTLVWLMVLPSLPVRPKWFARLLAARLAGEAFNSVLPAAGLGGEPLKAVLLNRHYAIAHGDAIASIVLARTVNMLTQLVFVAGGVAIGVLVMERFRPLLPYALSGFGFLVFALAIVFSIQRFQLSSWLVGLLGRRLVARFTALLALLQDIEGRFIHFYTSAHARFAATAAVSLAGWFIGALEVWAAMRFLGSPVTFQEAWVIEAAAQVARSAAFLIPGALGAQEGAFTLVVSALTGDASVGLAVAMVRRGRELLWILVGFLSTLWFSARRRG